MDAHPNRSLPNYTLAKTILFVEDDLLIARREQALLEKHGMTVLIAADGETAVDIAANAPKLDLILMEIDLKSGIDGAEAAQRILTRRDLPIIFMFSHANPDAVEKAKEIAAYGYLVKNSGESVLLASVNMALTLFDEHQYLKHQNATLRESDTLFRTQFELGNIGITIASPEKTWLYVNQRLCEMLGYSEAELRQLTWSDLTHPDDLEADIAQFQRVMAGEIDRYEIEKRFIKKDGSMIFTHLTVSCSRNPDQTVRFTIGSILDITDRKLAEEALRISEEKYRVLVETSTDVIWTINEQQQFTYISPAIQQLRGLTPEEAMRESLMEAVCPEYWPLLKEIREEHNAAFWQNERDVIKRLEIQQPCKDGGRVWVDVITRGIWNESGEYTILGISRNITRRKQMETELIQAKNTAEAANRSKSAFLANMSHELRTPLNSILGYSQILNRDDTLVPRYHEYATFIEHSGRHLLAMINDILDLAKVEAGKLEVHPRPMHLPSLMNDVQAMITLKVEQKGLSFDLIQDAYMPEYVEGDEHRLRQILLNLLGNAVKFTDHGGVTLRVGATPSVRPKKEQTQGDASTSILYFEISDTGIGIASDDVAKLFTPFQQVGDTVRKAQGTGLGLAISRNLAELMGGILSVSSAIGVGSVFRFEVALPVMASDDWQPPAYRMIEGVKGAAPLILVVDDEAENRRVLKELLTSWGCHVMEAENGREAVRLAAAVPPSAIITDLRMPDMGGVELIQHLRQTPEFQHIPVIASSASVYLENQQESLIAGARAFLPKPIDANALSALLSELQVVEWRYKEETSPFAAGRRSVETNSITGYSTIPKELLDKLQQVTIIADVEKIHEAIHDIRTVAPAFADDLEKLAYHFEYDKIMHLLQNIQ